MMENHNNVLSNRYRQIASQLTGIGMPASRKEELAWRFLFISDEEVRNDATDSRS